MIVATLGLFFVVLTLLAIQVRTGRDPALGPGPVIQVVGKSGAKGTAAQSQATSIVTRTSAGAAAMSAATLPAMRRAGPRTRAAAALVLIGLAALAYYALFAGPTTYSVPSSPRAAPARSRAAAARARSPRAAESERRAEPDPANYPWWLASRSAGIVAFVLIAASVTLGLFMASGVYRRPGLKRDLLKVHQHLALAGLTMIGLHGVLLLGDKWLKPGIAGIAVPFAISYRPVWVGLGIFGGYLAALLGPTYFVRGGGSAPGAGAASTRRPSSSTSSPSSTRSAPAPTAPAPGSPCSSSPARCRSPSCWCCATGRGSEPGRVAGGEVGPSASSSCQRGPLTPGRSSRVSKRRPAICM